MASDKKNIDITSIRIYRILKTVMYSFFIFCSLLFVLYFVGNLQKFQDSSLKLILTVISYCSIFNTLLSVPALIEDIFLLITQKKKKKYISALISTILIFIFNMIYLILSSVIEYLSAGV